MFHISPTTQLRVALTASRKTTAKMASTIRAATDCRFQPRLIKGQADFTRITLVDFDGNLITLQLPPKRKGPACLAGPLSVLGFG
tara:strand:+ start:686 stop:940 length:255 start_codon:yes stop_codon:yes gene_type:complete